MPDCTASDAEILLLGMSACPPASHVGRSHGATSMSGLGAGDDPIDLDFWDDAGVLVLWGARISSRRSAPSRAGIRRARR